MKQVFLKNGQIVVEEVRAPTPGDKEVLVANAFSLISGGTEGAALKSGTEGLLAKALRRPDLVEKVWQKVREEGVRRTWRKVREKTSQAQPLGYSTAGQVVAGPPAAAWCAWTWTGSGWTWTGQLRSGSGGGRSTSGPATIPRFR
ncbi:MAG: hypothetical protein D9V47_01640 [Clostridia bacterium]|nr:MAG: hypothetical protein D9V47_01640 [Clostridia bacterium]